MARRLIAQIDRGLVAVTASLSVLGLYNLASAGKPLGQALQVTHGAHILVGVLVAAVIAAIPYRHFEGLATPGFLLTVLMLVATVFFGKIVNGSRRWLVLGPVNVQTSDLAKLAVILIVARIFHREGWDGGGLMLREIFRPLNVSRPLLIVLVVLALSLWGDALKPPVLLRGSGRQARRVAELRGTQPQVVVGSRKSDDVQVPLVLSGVSRRHAEILRIEDNHYVIKDLDTEAGTYVNGTRVGTEERLHDGDQLRFGLNHRAQLTFRAPLERLKPAFPWIALFGSLWLFLSLYLLFKSAKWTARDAVAPIDWVALPSFLILIQPDLGTTIVVLLIAFSMILYVGLRPASAVLLVSLSLVGGVVAWSTFLKPYQKERVLTFLNPASDLTGAGYHQHQSLIAIGSGEFWGKGHGQGTQTQLSFLPEQQTDFIFSVWAEEQGFLGCVVVVALFMGLLLLSLRIARQARDRFGTLLAVGVTAMIFWHTVVNMLMVLRLAPVVGVPLPLWSNGGSFVVTVLVGIGILANVSMRRHLF